MDSEGVRVPVPPSEHPRLYLRGRDLPDLKRRTSHPVLQPVWEELQTLAVKNEQIRVEVDALRSLLTRDDALARRTALAAVELMERSKFDRSAQDVTRPIGRLMVTGAIAYDWCYPALTTDLKKRYLDQLLRLAKELECGYPPWKRGYVTGHGSEWMIMRDMLSAGIALYDEYPEMYRLAANRFFGALLPARNFWYPGHAFHQGSSYAETRFVSDTYPLWIFERLGAGNVYHPAQQFVPYSWIYMRRPDGQLLRSGDGQSKVPKLRSLLTASYYGDGYVLADYLRDPGIDAMSKIFEFLWRDPDLEALPVSNLPLARYMGFPYGWMVARTGWDAASVIAEMKVNIFNFVNHQHLDAGAFQIYYQGPLAIDSGLYEGTNGAYGSPHHSNYYRRTIAHNTLLVYDPDEKFSWSRNVALRNDGGQRLPMNWREPGLIEDLLKGDYKTGEVLGHSFGPDPQHPEYAYLKGDITQAYSAKMRKAVRSFVFLNLGGADVPAALVVFDRVVSSNPAFRKYWLLHSMEEPSVDDNRTVLSLSQRGWTGKLVNTTLLPQAGNFEITKVGGPGKEYWVFGENFPNEIRRGNPNDYELGAWRIELSPKRAAETDVFLNVMQMTASAEGNVHPVESIAGDGITGVQVAGRAILFQQSAEKAGRPVTFRLSGSGTHKILVADLAEGTWQVWRDGRIMLPAVEVFASAGVLWLEGPAGLTLSGGSSQTGWHVGCQPVSRLRRCGCPPVSLRHGDNVRAPVLLPARLVVLGALRAFLAVADHLELFGGDAKRADILLRRFRAGIAERHVVLHGSAFVAVSLDGQLVIRVLPQDIAERLSVGQQGLFGIGTQAVLVVIEVRVLDARQQPVDAGARRRVGIARLHRLGRRRTRGLRPRHASRSRRAGSGGRRGRRRRRRRRYLLLGARRAERAECGQRDQRRRTMNRHKLGFPPLLLNFLRQRTTILSGQDFSGHPVSLHWH